MKTKNKISGYIVRGSTAALFFLCVIVALSSAINLPNKPPKVPTPENILSPAPLRPSAATHEARAQSQGMLQFVNANKVTPRIETVSWSPPTRSSFMATWGSVSGAKGYLLDVSTSNSFSSYADGYHGLDVGNVTGRAVTGLNPGTTYYYRVRPYTAAGAGGYSNMMTARTETPTGLIINPTWDCSIMNDPSSAAIEAMILRAIGIYESLFSDPITIHILFRYSTGGPAPSPSPTPSPTASPTASPTPSVCPSATPFPPGVLATSQSAIYTVSWNNFISQLRADARTSNDNVANASLPGSALSTNIAPSSANGRAVGLNTPPAMFSDGHIGPGGPYDGIVTLNSAEPFSFTRPLISGSFDAQRAVEHEIDEVMGLGTYLNNVSPCPSFEAESRDNTLTGSAVVLSCPTCSGGFKVSYVGNNSGTLQFNGVSAIVPGSNVITIWYTNGDAERNALLSVNGGTGIPVSFPSTGSFETVGSIQTTVTLNAGSNNTLVFYNPIPNNWAPDFDRIVVNCNIPPSADLRPQDLFSWSSPGVRNRTSNGSRYFSINSGSTNIVGFNQTPPGDFGDWLSEACPQAHPRVQNAFVCPNQFSDISATSPEGINLDVIGYDDLAPPPPPTPTPTPCAGFNDVPDSSPFCPFIEELVSRGITSGCAPNLYCPSAAVTRAQMAIFLLKALEGSDYTPPPCVPGQEMFNDVPASSPFCPWIEELVSRGITSGCAPNLYCPSASVTRAQMAILLLKALEGSGYTPPPCVPGQEIFNDVPASSPFCPWIGELVRRGITSGCGGGNYCPSASVTRQQMAVFLVGTF